MKNNKIMKAFLMLITALAITMGMSGCGESTLSERQVIEKIKELAQNDRDQIGYCVEVRSVNNHFGSLPIGFLRIFRHDIPECDEVWVTEIHSDKWKYCIVRLCRRGSYYFLNFNPQDK